MPDEVIDQIRTAGWREGAFGATVLQVSRQSLSRMKEPGELPPPPDRSLKAPPGRDPEDPRVGKWAILTLEAHKQEAAESLSALVEHRRSRNQLWGDGVVAITRSEAGTVDAWLRRLERATGDEPPHYWLIVGGPDEIPFSLQYELDLIGLTGRLDATDQPGGPLSWEACRRYANKVVEYELGGIAVSPKPLFYSVTSDAYTRNSHEYLIRPLADGIPGGVTSLYGDEATASGLLDALDVERAPKVVFAASHGVENPCDAARWGALTAAGFRGRARDPVVSADAIESRDRAGYGSIFFSFACYSAGVPQHSVLRFLADTAAEIEELEPRISPLPRQLLGHPRGPVAFVGHVDRVSAVAFNRSYGMAGIDPYDHFVGWLGSREGTLGRAMGTFRDQTKRVGAQIAASLEAATADDGTPANAKEAGRKWVGFNDYRGFMLIGDPALAPATAY